MLCVVDLVALRAGYTPRLCRKNLIEKLRVACGDCVLIFCITSTGTVHVLQIVDDAFRSRRTESCRRLGKRGTGTKFRKGGEIRASPRFAVFLAF